MKVSFDAFVFLTTCIIEPDHDKTNKMTCASSEDSDQSSLCSLWVAKDPAFLQEDSEDSDPTWRMTLVRSNKMQFKLYRTH